MQQSVESAAVEGRKWLARGEAMLSAGNAAEAIECLGRAASLAPAVPQTHNLLAIALAQSGRRAEAIAAVSQAIRLDPNLPQAHHNLGTALAEDNRLEEAIVAFRRAVELA